MDWRPFKLLNASERAWLEGVARSAASDWLAEWLPQAALGAVHCRDACERASTGLAQEPRWIGCGQHGAPWLSIALGHDVQRLLAERLFGTEAQSALIADVTAAALADLAQRLLGRGVAGQAAAAPPDAGCWQRGSGAAIFEIDIDDRVLALLAQPRWVQKQLAARPRATPAARASPIDPRQCIGHAGVEVQAWAGGAGLEIGLLQSLAIGDVIRLDSRIDQALRITVQGHDTGRGAYLGSLDGRRAVQLAASR